MGSREQLERIGAEMMKRMWTMDVDPHDERMRALRQAYNAGIADAEEARLHSGGMYQLKQRLARLKLPEDGGEGGGVDGQ